MIVIGIDPGINGAVAAYDTEERLITVNKIPKIRISRSGKPAHAIDVPELAQMVRDIVNGNRAIAYLEDVHSMPGQGVASSFRFGEAKGIILGVLVSQYIPVELVSPATWKRHFRLGADKRQSRLKASQLFPGLKIPDINCAEALLIMQYGIDCGRVPLL